MRAYEILSVEESRNSYDEVLNKQLANRASINKWRGVKGQNDEDENI